MRVLRSTMLMCVLALTCACQATSFQTPPLADGDCDPALAGGWVSLDDKGVPNGDLRLLISASCQINLTGTSVKQAPPEGPTQAHMARHGGQSYAWLDAGWANRMMEVKEFQVDPGDVYLFRYEVHDDELLLQTVDHKVVAHRIIDGDIAGTVRSDENVLVNRVTGIAQPIVLDVPGLFSKDASRFGREHAKP